MMAELNAAGVEVSLRPGQFAYGPSSTPGVPGNMVLDPKASLSAVQHEYSHFLGDKALGFPGARYYYENPGARLSSERSAYLVELGNARSIGDLSARRSLIQDYLSEKQYLISNFYEKPYGN